MKQWIGISLAGLLALSIGCKSGEVVLYRVDPEGKPILLSRNKLPSTQDVHQAVQTAKDSVPPSGHGQAPVNPPSAVTVQAERPPVLKVDDLEPASPPPANTPVIQQPDIQDDKHSTKETRYSGSSGGGGGGGGGGSFSAPRPDHTTPQPNHFLTISNVYLTDEGPTASIVGAEAPREISPEFNTSTEITLTIEGDFRTAPATTLDNMSFVFDEPKVVAMSLVGKEPPVRVLLDSVILLTPVEASATKIVAKLDSRGYPDLYLKGQHTLSVEGGHLMSQVKVKVGEPLSPASLSPIIEKVEILNDPVTNRPANLRVTGKNLMMHYRFSYAQLDQQFAWGHQTTLLQEEDGLSWESIIHIPDIDAFEDENSHTLSVVTPFGAGFKTFQGGQQ